MAALKRMTARDRGTIVQVGSALSYRAIPLQAAYCGSKFAIRGFTDSIRSELLHDKSSVHITMVQLPGVNTTQFNWCRSKLPDHPQPVPPIYQPEIPAEAVYWAAHHRRRELWVGYSAVEAIVGNKIAPGFADRYLAHKAFSGQQVKNMPVPPDRPDNLFEPVPELAATHGIFDDRAKRRSPQLWANTHRALLAGARCRWRGRRRRPGSPLPALDEYDRSGRERQRAAHPARVRADRRRRARGTRWSARRLHLDVLSALGLRRVLRDADRRRRDVRGDARRALRLGRLLRARADLVQQVGDRRRADRVPRGAGAARSPAAGGAPAPDPRHHRGDARSTSYWICGPSSVPSASRICGSTTAGSGTVGSPVRRSVGAGASAPSRSTKMAAARWR